MSNGGFSRQKLVKGEPEKSEAEKEEEDFQDMEDWKSPRNASLIPNIQCSLLSRTEEHF